MSHIDRLPAPTAHPDDHRLWVLGPTSLVLLPFLLAALLGLRPEVHAGLTGAALLGLAAWKTQGHSRAGLQSPVIGAVITALFLGLWLREAVLCAWSPLLALAPVPAIAAVWTLAGLQLADRCPDRHLIEGASTVLFFTAASLAGLTLPMLQT